jgi:GTP-binding protein
LNIDAAFVISATAARDFPQDALPGVALVGRSNVGKSSLINALLRQRIARTSAAPGKTRLANIYRVKRGDRAPLYLADLPGYGYARGGDAGFEDVAGLVFERFGAVLLLVDSRHPGLASDKAAWAWLSGAVAARAIVATKIDKLSRAERQRAIHAYDAVFEPPVLPVSAVTGEGLDELWTLIDKLANNSRPRPPRNSSPPRAATPRLRKR